MDLAGDIGGTKVWLELSSPGPDTGPGRDPAPTVLFERRYESSKYACLADVLRTFLSEHAQAAGRSGCIQRACFGVAGPVCGDRVKVTNLPWSIDARELSDAFGISRVTLVNDFAAAAHGIDALEDEALATLQAGEPDAHGQRVLIGAGTGLGVAYSVWAGRDWRAIAGEGGHIGFAPMDAIQAELWREIRDTEGRVAAEHVVSGPGLTRLYDFFRRRTGVNPVSHATPADARTIIARARAGRDPAAQEALALFAGCYGAVAGDHALAVLARGGVYICGGVAPGMLPELAGGGFLAAFNAKGPHAGMMGRIPVHVVTDTRLGLHGARHLASQL